MRLISRNTDYAVRALCYIYGKDGEVVSVTELVKALKIPHAFLRKILQVLNKKNILKSNKGAGGGFRLARNADDIYLVDLMKIFQGKFRLNECFFKKETCPNRKMCWLKDKIDSIEDAVYKELSSITIMSIVKGV